MENIIEPQMFVPAFPTIWPEMLLKNQKANNYYPFSSPSVRYFYFARNAVWHTVKFLRLDKGEVLVPAYHHGVEIEALIDAGAKVKFYRITDKWDIDLEDVEKKINKQTSALYLTHFGGFPGPVREMKKLAEKYNLPLIEDCALSLFSMDGDIPLGITGDVAIFCLYKVLPVPNGGAMVINCPGQYNVGEPGPPPLSSTISLTVSSILRNIALRGGKIGREVRRQVLKLGKKTLHASMVKPILTGTQHFNPDHLKLGISQLTKQLLFTQNIPDIIEKRRRNYRFLETHLGDLSRPIFDHLPEGVVPLFYPMEVKDNKQLADQLLAKGIEAVDFWRDFHPACNALEFPEVAKMRRSMVEIPCHQDISLKTLTKIVSAVREIYQLDPYNFTKFVS